MDGIKKKKRLERKISPSIEPKKWGKSMRFQDSAHVERERRGNVPLKTYGSASIKKLNKLKIISESAFAWNQLQNQCKSGRADTQMVKGLGF